MARPQFLQNNRGLTYYVMMISVVVAVVVIIYLASQVIPLPGMCPISL